MGYLVLSRKEGEQIRLTIDPDVKAEKLRNLSRKGFPISMGEMGGV